MRDVFLQDFRSDHLKQTTVLFEPDANEAFVLQGCLGYLWWEYQYLLGTPQSNEIENIAQFPENEINDGFEVMQHFEYASMFWDNDTGIARIVLNNYSCEIMDIDLCATKARKKRNLSYPTCSDTSQKKVKITGRIICNGNGVENVTMTGFTDHVITDNNGYYQATVESGWEGTITPKKNGYYFVPKHIEYKTVYFNRTDQNYISQQVLVHVATPYISGTTYALVGEEIIFTAHSANSEQYEFRYNWGDKTGTDWGKAERSHVFTSPGKYCVRSIAKNMDEIQSDDWSQCFMVTINQKIENKPPIMPEIFGPIDGFTGSAYTFVASSKDPENSDIQYRFDWGNFITEWQVHDSATHIWDQAGYFIVKAQAKDIKGEVSSWSNAHTIHIEQSNRTPEIPAISGNSTILIGEQLSLKARSVDPDGDHYNDNVSYQFDWGDGSKSEWLTSVNEWSTASHIWNDPGIYCVTVIAKDSNGLISKTSPCKNIQVIRPNHVPQNPMLTGPSFGYINQSYTFNASATDSDFDLFEFQLVVHLPDGNTSTQWQTNASFVWSWNSPGTYCLKIGVRDDPLHMPVWSNCHTIAIYSEEVPCKVRLYYPDPDNEGGNAMCNGKYFTNTDLKIQWVDEDGNKDSDITRSNIYYSIAGGDWIYIGAESNDTAFLWPVPPYFVYDNVRFKVIASYNTGCQTESISKPINFLDGNEPDITILKPISGTYYVDEPVAIEWQAQCPTGYDVTKVDIKFVSNGSNKGNIVQLYDEQAQSGFYSWIPENHQLTDSGQIEIFAWCNNCNHGELLNSQYFGIQFKSNPKSYWHNAQQPIVAPSKLNYMQYIMEPDLWVDSKGNIHIVSAYTDQSNANLPLKGESQIYYRKMNTDGTWNDQEKATSYQEWQSTTYDSSCCIYSTRYPQISVDQNDMPHIVYEYLAPGSSDQEVMYIRKPREYRFFLQVWSNDREGEIAIKYYDASLKSILQVRFDEILSFSVNMENGSIQEPVMFSPIRLKGDIDRNGKVNMEDVLHLFEQLFFE
jgi:hypothetical protein